MRHVIVLAEFLGAEVRRRRRRNSVASSDRNNDTAGLALAALSDLDVEACIWAPTTCAALESNTILMPVKRRAAKQRTLRDFAPLQAWIIVFKCGSDHLNRLRAYGITGEDQVRAAMAQAWRRHGAEFIGAIWKPSDTSALPWALEQFGPPPGARHAR
jgi:hypothetical protein